MRNGFVNREWRDALLDRMAHTAKDRLRDRRAELYDHVIANELRRIGGPDTALDALLEHERQELRAIDAALERMSDGKWGTCERCAMPIGLQRLTALPEAALCIRCSDA